MTKYPQKKVQLLLDPSDHAALQIMTDYYGVSNQRLVRSLLRVAYLAYQRDSTHGTKDFMHGHWPANEQPPEGWQHETGTITEIAR